MFSFVDIIIIFSTYLVLTLSANQLLNLPGKSKVPMHYCIIEVSVQILSTHRKEITNLAVFPESLISYYPYT